MTFEIVNSTAKAHKLSDENGVEFWVPKKWYREAKGTLTPKGTANHEAALAKANGSAPAQEENFVDVPVDWESERAIGVDLRAEWVGPSSSLRLRARDQRERVFFPRSVLRDGKVPARMFYQKMREASEDLREYVKFTCFWSTGEAI